MMVDSIAQITSLEQAKAFLSNANSSNTVLSTTELKQVISKVGANVEGATSTLLYSGQFDGGTNAWQVAEDIAKNSNGKVALITQSNAGKLLLSQELRDAVDSTAAANNTTLDQLLSGRDANGIRISADSLDDYASELFVKNATGEVRIITNPTADPNSVFAKTELKALLDNPDITSIDGVSKADFDAKYHNYLTHHGGNEAAALEALRKDTAEISVKHVRDNIKVTYDADGRLNGVDTGDYMPERVNSITDNTKLFKLNNYGDYVDHLKAIGTMGTVLEVSSLVSDAYAAHEAGDTAGAQQLLTDWTAEFAAGAAAGYATGSLAASVTASLAVYGPVGVGAAATITFIAGVAGAMGGEAAVREVLDTVRNFNIDEFSTEAADNILSSLSHRFGPAVVDFFAGDFTALTKWDLKIKEALGVDYTSTTTLGTTRFFPEDSPLRDLLHHENGLLVNLYLPDGQGGGSNKHFISYEGGWVEVDPMNPDPEADNPSSQYDYLYQDNGKGSSLTAYADNDADDSITAASTALGGIMNDLEAGGVGTHNIDHFVFNKPGDVGESYAVSQGDGIAVVNNLGGTVPDGLATIETASGSAYSLIDKSATTTIDNQSYFLTDVMNAATSAGEALLDFVTEAATDFYDGMANGGWQMALADFFATYGEALINGEITTAEALEKFVISQGEAILGSQIGDLIVTDGVEGALTKVFDAMDIPNPDVLAGEFGDILGRMVIDFGLHSHGWDSDQYVKAGSSIVASSVVAHYVTHEFGMVERTATGENTFVYMPSTPVGAGAAAAIATLVRQLVLDPKLNTSEYIMLGVNAGSAFLAGTAGAYAALAVTGAKTLGAALLSLSGALAATGVGAIVGIAAATLVSSIYKGKVFYEGEYGDLGQLLNSLYQVQDITLEDGSTVKAVVAVSAEGSVVFTQDDIVHLLGGSGSDTLVGDGDDENISGGDGSDYIEGAGGDDVLLGGNQHDHIEGGTGDDHIQGDAGHDMLFGNLGADTIMGGSGDDAIHGGKGADILTGGSGDDLIFGGGDDDILSGDEGDDILDGGAGNDQILGGVGDDVLMGNLGNDILQGEDGNDTLLGQEGDDQIGGGAGNDRLAGGDGIDVLTGDTGDDFLTGGWGNDYLDGGIGNDRLMGGLDEDTLIGGLDDDVLDGGYNDDILQGGDGNDILKGDLGHDALDGGAGDDSYVFRAGDGQDTISDASGNDILSLEGILSSSLSFTKIGDDLQIGLGGGDQVTITNQFAGQGLESIQWHHGAGIDLSTFTVHADDSVSFQFATDYDTTRTNMAKDALAAMSIEEEGMNQQLESGLLGKLAEESYQDAIWNSLDSGAYNGEDYVTWKRKRSKWGGHYTIYKQAKHPVLEGEDKATYSLTKFQSVDAIPDTPEEGVDYRIEMAKLYESPLYDSLGRERILQRKDIYMDGKRIDIQYFMGDDQMGFKEISGWSVYYNGNNRQLADSGPVSFCNWFKGTFDTSPREVPVIFKETIIESSNDKLIGGWWNETLRSGAGDDIVAGGNGDDTVSGGSGNDAVYGGSGSDTVSGGTGEDVISGGSGDDTLTGGLGDDILLGGAGDDTLSGDWGNDLILAGDGADVIYGGEGDDTIYAGDGDDKAFGGTGIDIILGQGGNDTLYGDEGRDWLYGEADDDKLYGATGDDRLYGGEGNDFLSGNEQKDLLLGMNGDDRLYGGEDNDRLYGGEGKDVLRGDEGNDTLNGQGGDDVLFGDAGDDIIDGGAGFDTVYYHHIASNIRVDLAAATVTNSITGNDTLQNIEKIMLGLGNDWAYGSSKDDMINGYTGNDFLRGRGGNDKLFGHAGDNRFYGDEGDDIFYTGTVGTESFNGGTGTDSVAYYYSSQAITLNLTDTTQNTGGAAGDSYTGVERFYGSKGHDTMIGDSNDNLLSGYQGNDTLYGGAGHDRIYGYSGGNSLYGEDGDDFLYAGSTGVDAFDGGNGNDGVAYYYASSAVTINLELNSFMRGAAGDSYHDIERFYGSKYDDYMIGNTNDDYLHGYLGNDVLRGREGNDKLFAHAGDNRLYGEEGNDTLYAGSTGTDILYGGDGNDKVNYTYSNLAITLNLADTTQNTGGAAGDTYNSIEYFIGSKYMDTMIGNNANNNLNGNSGHDTIDGGAGADYLTGGAGNDTFNFAHLTHSTNTARDIIHDFEQGKDHIDLSDLGFTSLGNINTTNSGGNTFVNDNSSDFSIELKGTHSLVDADFVWA